MAAADGDDSLYPIAVLIDELRNEDVQVRRPRGSLGRRDRGPGSAGGPRGKGSEFAGSGGRGGGQSAPGSLLSGSWDSRRRRPGLGVGPAEGGSEGEPPGSRACLVRAAFRGLGGRGTVGSRPPGFGSGEGSRIGGGL